MQYWKITRINKTSGKIQAIQYWKAGIGGKSYETAMDDLKNDIKLNKHIEFKIERV